MIMKQWHERICQRYLAVNMGALIVLSVADVQFDQAGNLPLS